MEKFFGVNIGGQESDVLTSEKVAPSTDVVLRIDTATLPKGLLPGQLFNAVETILRQVLKREFPRPAEPEVKPLREGTRVSRLWAD